MIGLDTNVVVRYLVKEEKTIHQHFQAKKLLESLTPEAPGFLSLLVMQEIYYVLRTCYGRPRQECLEILEGLLSTSTLCVEEDDWLKQAIDLCKTIKPDLNDCLISLKAKKEGCEVLYSFDAKAQRDLSMRSLPEFKMPSGQELKILK